MFSVEVGQGAVKISCVLFTVHTIEASTRSVIYLVPCFIFFIYELFADDVTV